MSSRIEQGAPPFDEPTCRSKVFVDCLGRKRQEDRLSSWEGGVTERDRDVRVRAKQRRYTSERARGRGNMGTEASPGPPRNEPRTGFVPSLPSRYACFIGLSARGHHHTALEVARGEESAHAPAAAGHGGKEALIACRKTRLEPLPQTDDFPYSCSDRGQGPTNVAPRRTST